LKEKNKTKQTKSKPNLSRSSSRIRTKEIIIPESFVSEKLSSIENDININTFKAHSTSFGKPLSSAR